MYLCKALVIFCLIVAMLYVTILAANRRNSLMSKTGLGLFLS